MSITGEDEEEDARKIEEEEVKQLGPDDKIEGYLFFKKTKLEQGKL